MIWREKLVENRIGDWVKHYRVSTANENSKKLVVKKAPDAPHERYHMTQVKHFLDKDDAATDFIEVLHSTFANMGVAIFNCLNQCNRGSG